MIVLGLILLLLGYLFGIQPLLLIGLVFLIVGAVLVLLGGLGHPIGGRGHWY